MAIRSTLALIVPAFLALTLTGCADPQPTGTPIRVDPTKTQAGSGGSDDILQVCSKMVGSMRQNKEVAPPPMRLIVLDSPIKVDPKLRGYDGRLLYNQFKADLNRVASSEFRFIDRNAVQAERAKQLSGEAKTSGVEKATAGADYVLSIELLAVQGGDSTTVQYNFQLTDLSGVTLWSGIDTIVKRG